MTKIISPIPAIAKKATVPADMLSREEIERFLAFRGDYLEVRREHIHELAQHVLSEPDRIEAARQEGYREGVEACAVWLETQAAAFLDARDQHMRACEATKGGSLAEEMHSRRACSAEATAASLSEAAAGLRRLCPPSAKPDAAVAEVGSDK